MQHGDGAAGLDLLYSQNSRAGNGAIQKLPVSGDGVWLILVGEILSCYAQEDGGNVAAIGDWKL